MVRGLGIDLLETERLAAALARHGSRLERRLFTEAELADCRERRDRVLALAARFAAKEACFKALGTGWGRGVGWRDVEIRRGPSGEPHLRLRGAAAEHAARLGVTSVRVSLTHQPHAAAAVVLLWGQAPGSSQEPGS